MNKLILLFVFTLIFSAGFSQITFESGYFIDESDQKTECFIKNREWEYNPSNFEYQLSRDGVTQVGDLGFVKEFCVNGKTKYIRALVKIDKASDHIDKMSKERNPVFLEEQLFLKVLIEGEASLFLYKGGDIIRFFFRKNDSEISQLVYRKFLLISNYYAENNYFRQQLFVELECPAIKLSDIENIRYTRTDLKKIVIKYNEYNNPTFVNYDIKEKKDVVSLSFRPGLNYSTLPVQNNGSLYSIDFGGMVNVRFGLELEYILPINKNKWRLIVEPTYQYFNKETSRESDKVSGGILFSKANYQSIELPVGVRHYFYINDKSTIFTNLSFITDFTGNSTIVFTRADGSILNDPFKISSGGNFALGVGYNYNEKISFEMRYQTKRNVLNQYVNWSSEYETFSVILGYSLF